jgi:hypothetical protein
MKSPKLTSSCKIYLANEFTSYLPITEQGLGVFDKTRRLGKLKRKCIDNTPI